MTIKLNTLQDVERISEKIPPILFVNHDVFYGIGLEEILPNYHILASGENSANSHLKRIFYTSDYKSSSFDLLTDKRVGEYISQFASPNLIFFKPSARYYKFCRKKGWNVLNNDPADSLRLENKFNLPEILDSLKIPYPKTIFMELKEGIEFELSKELGETYVVQFARSFGGNNTFWIREARDLQELRCKYEGKSVKVAEYIEGWRLTINACVTQFGVVISYPFHQLTGIDILTKSELGACGNDWGEIPVEDGAIQKIIDFTEKIGIYLGEQNYKGIFGLDFVVDGWNQVFTIEINPRLLATIPVFTQFQMENNEIPMLLLHCLEFLDIDYEIDIQEVNRKLQQPRRISQIILHNLEEGERKIGKLDSGVYKLNLHNLLDIKFKIKNINNKDQFLLLTQENGRRISENGEISRIFLKDNILDLKNRELKPKYNQLVRKVYERQVNRSF